MPSQRGKSILYVLLMSSGLGTLASGQEHCCQRAQLGLNMSFLDGLRNGGMAGVGLAENLAGGQQDAGSIRVKRGGKAAELTLSSLKGKPDAEVVRALAGLELTERMGTQQLEVWKAEMPGELSRRQLTALADTSAFLGLQPSDLPKDAPLDKEAQEKLLEQMKAYVDKTMARLPNFFATQDVTTFQAIEGMRNGANVIEHQPMHYVGEVTANVLYRSGKEVVENGKGELKESDQVGYRLLFSGQFGPVLNTVMSDAEQGKLTWSRWEASGSTKLAVFRYSVARKKSHCNVKVFTQGNRFILQAHPGYHGEIAVNPEDGTILRLTLIADLNQDDPMSVANLMVEYGPVEVGGQSYICPIRSVTVETIQQADPNGGATVHSQRQNFDGPSHDSGMTYATNGDAPQEVLINDVAFTHYQLLRSDTKMITDDDQKSAPKQ